MMGQLGAATAAADADSAVTSASATTHGSLLLVLCAPAAARAILMNYLDYFFFTACLQAKAPLSHTG
jgi:hypothetical protein